MNHIATTERKTELLKTALLADSPGANLLAFGSIAAGGFAAVALHKPNRAPWVEKLF